MKLIKYTFLMLLLAVSVFFACKKERTGQPEIEGPQTQMQKIQQWYEKQVTERNNSAFVKENVPDWENASSFMVSAGLELITVPVYRNGQVYKELNINNKNGAYAAVIKKYTSGTGIKETKLEFFTLNGKLIEEGKLVFDRGYRYVKGHSANQYRSGKLMMAAGEPSDGGWFPEVDITTRPPVVIPLPFDPKIPPIIVKPIPDPKPVNPGGGGGSGPGPVVDPSDDGYPREIKNNLEEPCLKKALEALLRRTANSTGKSTSLEGKIATIINDFAAKIPALGNTTIPTKIESVEIRFIPSTEVAVAQAIPRFYGKKYDVTIKINEAYFVGESFGGEEYPKSEELFAQAVVHEILHTYYSQTMMALNNYEQHAMFAQYMIIQNAAYLIDYYGMDRKEAYGLAWAGIDPETMNRLFPTDKKVKYPDGSIQTINKGEAETIIANHMRFNKENGLGTPLDCK